MGVRSTKAVAALVMVMSLSQPATPRSTPLENDVIDALLESGEASYFSSEMAGRRTASGEPCNPDTLTAAHRTLAFGTQVRVTATETGRSVIVRINDRGPFRAGRVIDLSRAAADEIGLVRLGRGRVTIQPVE